ncbi:MAG: hypothetical protein ACKOXT_05945 [Actinomycetota bacterium]
MKNLILKIYAPDILARSLFITGVIAGFLAFALPVLATTLVSIDGAVTAILGAFFTYLSLVMIPASVGFVFSAVVVSLRRRFGSSKKAIDSNSKPSSGEQSKKLRSGRYTALAGFLFIFSPFIPVVLLSGSMKEGAGSIIYLWAMLYTIPLGLGIMLVGIVLGIRNMRKVASSSK